ncbi:hypothetical protein WR25_22809 [Diploscapter pachys]|uniref:Major facilitator superfamily (MFS) profile domain-containing protein n=1 Tax=Diploscapter pachys TaxID=2018661 RepID=A0A2A2JJP0_9BILA|nr:hypothetical protein WR25_22809 [Diploscapter pachys]
MSHFPVPIDENLIERVKLSSESENVGNQKNSLSLNYVNLDADKVLSAFGTFGRYQAGSMLGAPFITQLSDIFGRRWTFLGSLYLSICANLICAISPTYYVFLAFRLLAGVAATGFSSIGFILCMESVSTEFRDFIPLMSNFFWLVGYMLAGVFSTFIHNWRWLYFAITVPSMLTIPFYWCVPESLHWLITKKNTRAVRKYIHTSSRFNRSHIVLSECQSGTNLDSKQSKRTVIDIFRCGALLIHLIITSYVTITMNATYWALSLFSTDLSENKMLGFFLSGIVEFPAAIIALFAMKYFQRRWVAFFSLFFQSVAMLCAVYIPLPQNILMIFPLIAKSFNIIIWSVQPLLSTESVPTTVRNVFSGVVIFIGEFGSVIAPYFPLLEAINKNAPSLLIAVMSISSAIFVLSMPETKDQSLPEDIDDFKLGPFWNRIFSKSESQKTPSNDEEVMKSQNEVLAITTVHGCVNVDQAVANVNRTIRANNKTDILVFKGAADCLIGGLQDDPAEDFFFGKDGLGDKPRDFPEVLESDFKPTSNEHASSALIRLTKEHPDATLVCIGPLTNVAIALRLDPNFCKQPARVVIMGGNYFGIGNVDPTSSCEYNFHGDPEAAHVVLKEMQCPLTVVPWEAFFLEGPEHEKLVNFHAHLNYETPLASYFRTATSIGREKLAASGRQYAYCDEIAIATAISEAEVVKKSKYFRVMVELHGKHTRGQVVVNWMEQLWETEDNTILGTDGKKSDIKSGRSIKFVQSYDVKKVDEWIHAVASGNWKH